MLQYSPSSFFWLNYGACGILVPQPGIEPRPSIVRVPTPNHWNARGFPPHLKKQIAVDFCISVLEYHRLGGLNNINSYQIRSVAQSCPTLCNPWTTALQASLFTPGVYPNSCPLSQWFHPTISFSVVPSPPAFSLSQHQGLFQWVSSSHQVAKVEFQLQHQSFQWLVSFRMDWLDLLAVQGTLKSLLQHHSSKASILQCSAFFMVQLSHLYITARKPGHTVSALWSENHTSVPILAELRQ